MARNQSICIGNTNVIEGPYQETMDDPMKFSHQPSNGKRNHRTEQEFFNQLKMQIIEYMPKKISQYLLKTNCNMLKPITHWYLYTKKYE